nr:transposase [Holospora curviuscula]
MENFDFKTLLADKGYDVDNTVHYTGINKAVTPPTIHEENLVEPMFNTLTHFRRITPRYDKFTQTFLSFILLHHS